MTNEQAWKERERRRVVAEKYRPELSEEMGEVRETI